jgi:hypothetical protein
VRATLILFLTLSLVSGCSDLRKSARINPQSVAVYPGGRGDDPAGGLGNCPLTNSVGDSNRGAVDLDCFLFPENTRSDAKRTPAYDRAAKADESNTLTEKSANEESQRVARNRLGEILLKHADDVCTVEKGRLVRNETSVNFGLSFITTALSAAATIVTGERSKTILAGLATAASGTQDNFNATFYRNQLTQAITNAMDGERARLLTVIQGRKTETVAAFTIDDFVRMANSYHQACSFEHGLQLLLNASVDANGARASLESRGRQAAIATLQRRLRELTLIECKNPPEALKGSCETQIGDIRSKITALVVADATARTERPNAGDATASATDKSTDPPSDKPSEKE